MCIRHADRLWGHRQAVRLRALRRKREAEEAREGYAIPWAIVQCESGGANLPPNSAGASGYLQIVPGTWAAYGGTRYASEAWLATKAEQNIVGARIWAGGSGASQWVCKA